MSYSSTSAMSQQHVSDFHVLITLSRLTIVHLSLNFVCVSHGTDINPGTYPKKKSVAVASVQSDIFEAFHVALPHDLSSAIGNYNDTLADIVDANVINPASIRV